MPTRTQSIAQHHATWLSLIEISGPFLSMPVLERCFPQGLDRAANEDEVRHLTGLAYEEWADNQSGGSAEPALHMQWLRFVLQDVLEIDPSCILEGQQLPAGLTFHVAEYGETLRPTLAVGDPEEPRPRLLVQLYPASQNLEKPLPGALWTHSPAARLAQLLRQSAVRLGLVTNGRHWMLVDAPRDESTGFYTWDASLWSEEPLTLQAFRALLGGRRFFGVPEHERLENLLAESSQKQEQVTNQLGEQVRRAVATLVRTLDRLDKDEQRELLRSIDEQALYEAALTVMMRLVFLLSAEERGMLLLGDPLYEENYAVSTMYKQLREQADQQGEEVVERRYDAWSRLLVLFRLVYGGAQHQFLHLPAYGGRLFDPDRFPFLEGRQPGTHWRETPARPLKIDNRTVLHLLDALQFLRVRVGGVNEKRRLSFRNLDIEQIGHVYEGLLDHTARRASTTILSLEGEAKKEPEITLDELEEQARRGEEALLTFLHELTGRSVNSLARSLNAQGETTPQAARGDAASPYPAARARGAATFTGASGNGPGRRGVTALGLSQQERSKLMGACDNNQELFARVLPYAGLLRKDTFDDFLVVTPGSVYVTHGSDRRSTGTHYTPRSLTEPLVQHALDPLVYIGPAEGLPREQWQLRSAAEILDLKICDLAMGSGAFLVQTCRYLSEKLVEAWDAIAYGNARRADIPGADTPRVETRRAPGAPLHSQNTEYPGNLALARTDDDTADTIEHPAVHVATPLARAARGAGGESSRDIDERLATARRIVAERCLYGVDKNPMAVEMARLSLWLITLDKNKPFTFLDANLRCGDSLLGVNLRQLRTLAMDEQDVRQMSFMEQAMQKAIALALDKRREISMRLEQVAADAEEKARKLAEVEQATQLLKLGGDLLIAIALADPRRRANLRGTLLYDYELLVSAAEDARAHPLTAQGQRELEEKIETLRASVKELLRGRTPFHWPLEFPEVFANGGDEAGFAAIVGNPPFMGGKKITGVLGTDYRDYLLTYLADGKTGHADLCAYFFLRVTKLIRNEGMSALLATNTIAQGDTREVGLDQIVAKGWSIPRAIPSRKWPGEANLEVAHVWLRYGRWQGPYILDEQASQSITAFLSKSGQTQGKPYPLISNVSRAFIGSYVLGLGFVLAPEEAQALILKNPRNKDVLFSYLNGEDLNSRPDQSASRWVINFFDWPLEQAEKYTDCMKIVREKVKPERDRLGLKSEASAKGYAKLWWQHARKGQVLYSTIADMERVLVISRVTKYLTGSWKPTTMVYSEQTCIIAIESDSDFAGIQNTFHEEWARSYCSSLGLTLRYTPSDCFETFPFPTDISSLESIGQRYYEHRQSIMLARQEGLTKTYNRFHNSAEQAADIVQLRELHREMDEAVARAYGWEDLRLEHGFHETKQGLRYTISEEARREVLDRLLLLNHERHAQEVAAGLVDENGKPLKGKAKGAKKAARQGQTGEAAPVKPLEGGLAQGNLF